MNLIECIDHYFEDTKSHMDGILEELNKQYEINNDPDHVETVVWFYKGEILYNIGKMERLCRVLRDKLENG